MADNNFDENRNFNNDNNNININNNESNVNNLGTGTALQDDNNLMENYMESHITPKKSGKKIFVVLIAAVLVIGVLGTLFAKADFFKSNMEIAMAATNNSFSNYMNVNDEGKTLFSKLFNQQTMKSVFYNTDLNTSIKLNAVINKCSELPEWAEGAGGEININLDQSSNEESFDIKGTFNNLDFDIINAYANEEYFAFEVPIINEKFFMKWEDAPDEIYDMFIQMNSRNSDDFIAIRQQTYVLMSAFSEEFANTVKESLEINKVGHEEIGGYDCNVYAISMNNDEIKDFVKACFNNLLDNEEAFKAIEFLMEQSGFGGIGLNKDMLSVQFSKAADSLDIYGTDMTFYVDGNDLIQMEVDFKEEENKGYVCFFSFLGADNPSDDFKAEFYYYKDNEYRDGFLFTDKIIENGSEVSNEKMFTIKGKNEEEKGNISINTVYIPSTSAFSGTVEYDIKNSLSGTAATFNGTIINNDDLFDVNFDELSINSLGEEILNLSFGLKISELRESVNVIGTEGAVDIINDPESFENAMESIVDAIESYTVGKGFGL